MPSQVEMLTILMITVTLEALILMKLRKMISRTMKRTKMKKMRKMTLLRKRKENLMTS